MCENVVKLEAFEKCMRCALDCKEHSTYHRVGIQCVEEVLHCGRDRRNRANLHYFCTFTSVL